MWEVTTSDAKYVLCFASAMVIRLISVLYSVYMLLWLNSFIEKGEFSDENGALDAYRKIVMTAMVGTLLLLPLIGSIADKFPSHIVVPFSFFLRAMAALSFVQIERADTWLSYIASVVLIISTVIENVSIEVLFMRTMPGDVRGAMNGLFHLFG